MTESTARIEVSTSALRQLLNDVTPFVCTDETLPMINVVAFEFTGDDLIAVATDRYMLAVKRLPIGQAIVQPQRTLRLADVAQLLRAFPQPKGFDPPLAVTFGEQGMAVETSSTLDGEPTHRMAFPWATGSTFPSWRSIYDGATSGTATEQIVSDLNPQYLARFAKIQRDSEPVTIWPPALPSKPWKVTIGDHFIGLIMPMRRSGSEKTWTPAAVNVAEPVKKPAAKRAPRTKKAAA